MTLGCDYAALHLSHFRGMDVQIPFARVSHFHRMAVLVSMRHRFFDMSRRLLVIQVVDEGYVIFRRYNDHR